MLNHIVIMGRLTRDPELRYTQSQTPVASFTVAVDRDFGGRDGGEKTRPGCDNLEEKEADLGHDEAEDAAVERARGGGVERVNGEA